MKSPGRILAAFFVLTLGAGAALAAQSPQVPLAGSAIPQFVDPLPTLSASGGTMSTEFGNQPLTLRMCEFQANVLPTGTFAPGAKPKTWVWGYLADPVGGQTCAQLIDLYKSSTTGALDTYIGPVIVNNRGSTTAITFINDLGSASTTNVLAYKYSTDQTLHWADPLNDGMNLCNMSGAIPAYLSPCAQNYAGPVPAVPHLHGGEVPPVLDGGPDAWFTSDGIDKGHGYYTFPGAPANAATYNYPNVQEAAPLWFHDHTLGATRLNVYAGLAGAYLLTDPNNPPAAGMPGPAEIIPVVLQDRMFDTTGQLFFPADSAGGFLWTTNPDHPYWVPEFVGDTIVVNGKAWPFLSVQPKRYLFWFLNGSNARTYELFIQGGLPLWVIATDGGYLDAPAKVDTNQKLLMQPGERYLVMIDFAGSAGKNLLLQNTGRTPFPKGPPPNGSTLGKILQFRVAACPAAGCPADTSYNPALGTPLRAPMVRLVNPATGALSVTAQKTRQLTLNEVLKPPSTATDPVTGLLTKYPGGPLEILVNNTKWSGKSPRNSTTFQGGAYNDFTPVTIGGVTGYYSELPKEGETEVWEIVNTTADAHPIHLHLVQFQLINRQAYNVSNYMKAYAAAFPAATTFDPACIGGVFCPGFGPPLNYNTGNARALGGNPDVVPYLQDGVNPPLPYEAGWKDTVIMYPGQVTRIAVRWAPTDLPAATAPASAFFSFDPAANGHGYVWHCHIIDHEDNEMMRPDLVQVNTNATRTKFLGTDY